MIPRFLCFLVILAGCSSSSVSENEPKMVWVVTSPLSVDGNEYQCFMVMTSGQNVKTRSAVCVMPRIEDAENNRMMATVFDEMLSIGFFHEKTMALTNGEWETVSVLRQRENADEQTDPVRFKKTYDELGITEEKRFLPEMQSILETMIRENLPGKE